MFRIPGPVVESGRQDLRGSHRTGAGTCPDSSSGASRRRTGCDGPDRHFAGSNPQPRDVYE